MIELTVIQLFWLIFLACFLAILVWKILVGIVWIIDYYQSKPAQPSQQEIEWYLGNVTGLSNFSNTPGFREFLKKYGVWVMENPPK